MTAIDTTRMNIIKAVMRIDDLGRLQQLEQQVTVEQDIQKSIAFAGIERRENVAGGEARIVRTRIPVWLLVQARKSGTLDAEILKAYPSLRAEDISNAWNYYQYNRQEIDTAMLKNEMA